MQGIHRGRLALTNAAGLIDTLAILHGRRSSMRSASNTSSTLGLWIESIEYFGKWCPCIINEFVAILKLTEKGKSVKRRRRKTTDLRDEGSTTARLPELESNCFPYCCSFAGSRCSLQPSTDVRWPCHHKRWLLRSTLGFVCQHGVVQE